MLGTWRAIWAPGAATSISSRSSARAVAPADHPEFSGIITIALLGLILDACLRGLLLLADPSRRR